MMDWELPQLYNKYFTLCLSCSCHIVQLSLKSAFVKIKIELSGKGASTLAAKDRQAYLSIDKDD